MTEANEYNYVNAFLNGALDRIERAPEALPFPPEQARMVIAWLHGRLHAQTIGPWKPHQPVA